MFNFFRRRSRASVLEQEVECLRTYIDGIKRDRDTILKEKQDAEKRCEEADKNNVKLLRELKDKKHELSSMRKELLHMTMQNDYYENKTILLKSSLDEVKKQKSCLERKVQKMKTNRSQQDNNSELEQVSQENGYLKKELKKLSEELEASKKKLQEQQQRQDQTKDQWRGEVRKLREELELLQTNILDVLKSLDQKNLEIQNLKKELQTLEDQKKKIQDMTEEHVFITDQLNSKRSMNKWLYEELEIARAEMESNNEKLQQDQDKVEATCTTEVTKLRERLELLQKEYTHEVNSKAELSTQLRENLEQTKIENSNLKQELQTLKKQQQKKIDECMKELAKKMNMFETTKTQLNSAKSKLHEEEISKALLHQVLEATKKRLEEQEKKHSDDNALWKVDMTKLREKLAQAEVHCKAQLQECLFKKNLEIAHLKEEVETLKEEQKRKIEAMEDTQSLLKDELASSKNENRRISERLQAINAELETLKRKLREEENRKTQLLRGLENLLQPHSE